MKRDHVVKVKPRYGIKNAFPIFKWEICAKCEKDFRFEFMYRHCRLITLESFDIYHFCRNCAPTKQDAIDLLTERFGR